MMKLTSEILFIRVNLSSREEAGRRGLVASANGKNGWKVVGQGDNLTSAPRMTKHMTLQM